MTMPPAIRRQIRLCAAFARLPRRRQVLLVEAAVLLYLMRLVLAVLPFWQVRWYLNRRVDRRRPDGAARDRVCQDVVWAIERASARLAGTSRCFAQALAAQTMLRRRSIATTLYHGVALESGRLKAHVWLQDGPSGIIGHGLSTAYRVFARYPEP